MSNAIPAFTLKTLGSLKNLGGIACITIISMTISACNNDNDNDSSSADPKSTIQQNTKLTVALLGTTDLHTNLLSYDYFKLAEDKSIGLERTATLINDARKE